LSVALERGRATSPWRTAPNAISLGRAVLGVGVFAYAASASSASVPTGEAVALVVLLVISIALDGLDGWVARRRGSDSAVGSYVDVLCDRVTEDAGWIFLASQDTVWGLAILAVMLRNTAVDAVKAMSSFAGHDLEIGVLVTGWRLEVVRSRWSRVVHNGLKTLALAAGVLAIMTSWPPALAVTVVLLLFLLLSLARGTASLAEFPRTLRAGRVGPPARLWTGFTVQALLTFATLCAVAVVTFS
jgi:CDP-diacylglycerol--glycerol-3-phosphate 3-phosphatidyltransferase